MIESPVRIDVRSAQRTYPVLVGAGLLSNIGALLEEFRLANPAVVSVPPVWRLHGDRVAQLAGAAGPVLIPDGERAKNLQTISRLFEAFSERRLSRSDTIVAFGGGVVGDTAGFAAATYLRGLPLVQIPTTLLSQVDSAIGGKVGVNLRAGKNLAGAFHSPRLVVCDPDVLVTLPRREFRSGLYEVVKYGAIASRPLFDTTSRDLKRVVSKARGNLAPLIAACCRIKADVVEQDEHEAGPRRVLNFGHTVGHALETVTGYKRFKHGEAVAHGMLAAAHISTARGLLAADGRDELRDLIGRLGPLPSVGDLRRLDALEAMTRDKARRRRLHVSFELTALAHRTASVPRTVDGSHVSWRSPRGMKIVE